MQAGVRLLLYRVLFLLGLWASFTLHTRFGCGPPPPGLLTLLLLSRPLPTVTQQPLCPPSPAWCDSWLLLGKILGVTTLPTIPAPTTSLAPRLPQECWLTSPCLAPHPIILMNPKSSWPGTLCLLGVSLPYPAVHAMTEAGQGSGSPHTPKSS